MLIFAPSYSRLSRRCYDVLMNNSVLRWLKKLAADRDVSRRSGAAGPESVKPPSLVQLHYVTFDIDTIATGLTNYVESCQKTRF